MRIPLSALVGQKKEKRVKKPQLEAAQLEAECFTRLKSQEEPFTQKEQDSIKFNNARYLTTDLNDSFFAIHFKNEGKVCTVELLTQPLGGHKVQLADKINPDEFSLEQLEKLHNDLKLDGLKDVNWGDREKSSSQVTSTDLCMRISEIIHKLTEPVEEKIEATEPVPSAPQPGM